MLWWYLDTRPRLARSAAVGDYTRSASQYQYKHSTISSYTYKRMAQIYLRNVTGDGRLLAPSSDLIGGALEIVRVPRLPTVGRDITRILTPVLVQWAQGVLRPVSSRNFAKSKVTVRAIYKFEEVLSRTSNEYKERGPFVIY